MPSEENLIDHVVTKEEEIDNEGVVKDGEAIQIPELESVPVLSQEETDLLIGEDVKVD